MVAGQKGAYCRVDYCDIGRSERVIGHPKAVLLAEGTRAPVPVLLGKNLEYGGSHGSHGCLHCDLHAKFFVSQPCVFIGSGYEFTRVAAPRVADHLDTTRLRIRGIAVSHSMLKMAVSDLDRLCRGASCHGESTEGVGVRARVATGWWCRLVNDLNHRPCPAVPLQSHSAAFLLLLYLQARLQVPLDSAYR